LFAAFSPRSFRLATSLAASVFDMDRDVVQPFAGPWTSAIFDLGPQTVTEPLWLCQARLWCWVALTALGNFDPRMGGHLILWDLGCVLEFPPGCTIVFPAILRFSIARIQPGERRYSLTQYVAAPNSWQRWPAATHLFSKLRELSSLCI
ncbi:hypothetical protein B0H13DRAFT_1625275, partial [Mycena leptocephala]